MFKELWHNESKYGVQKYTLIFIIITSLVIALLLIFGPLISKLK